MSKIGYVPESEDTQTQYSGGQSGCRARLTPFRVEAVPLSQGGWRPFS